MKVLVWDSQSNSLQSFVDMATHYVEVDLYDDLKTLLNGCEPGDLVILELGDKIKEVEKTVKTIRKKKEGCNVLYLTEKMSPKEMAAHQGGKVGGEFYLRYPVDEKLFKSIMQPFFGEFPDYSEETATIISEHQEQSDIGEKTAATNVKLDDVFREALGEEESTMVLSELSEDETGGLSIDESELEVSLEASAEHSLDTESLSADLEVDLEVDLAEVEEPVSETEEVTPEPSLDGDSFALDLDDEGSDLNLSEGEEEAPSMDLQEDDALELDIGAVDLNLETSASQVGESLDMSEDSALDLDSYEESSDTLPVEEEVSEDIEVEAQALELSIEEEASIDDDIEVEEPSIEALDLGGEEVEAFELDDDSSDSLELGGEDIEVEDEQSLSLDTESDTSLSLGDDSLGVEAELDASLELDSIEEEESQSDDSLSLESESHETIESEPSGNTETKELSTEALSLSLDDSEEDELDLSFNVSFGGDEQEQIDEPVEAEEQSLEAENNILELDESESDDLDDLQFGAVSEEEVIQAKTEHVEQDMEGLPPGLQEALDQEDSEKTLVKDISNMNLTDNDAFDMGDVSLTGFTPDLEEDEVVETASEEESSLEVSENNTQGGFEIDELEFDGTDSEEELVMEEQDSGDLSSEELPDRPELGGTRTRIRNEMSASALEKLAQIEEILKEDALKTKTSQKPDATGEVDISALKESLKRPSGESHGESDLLADQLNSEEPDFDPTLDHVNLAPNLEFEEEGLSEAELESDTLFAQEDFEQHLDSSDTSSKEGDGDVSQDQHGEIGRLKKVILDLKEEKQNLLSQISKNLSDVGVAKELEEKKNELSLLQKRRSRKIDELESKLEISEEKRLLLLEKIKNLEVESDELRQKASSTNNRSTAREKELESKLELLKSDTETQIKNRDMKILELKRKVDTLEFDMETIQIKEKRTEDSNYAMEERMERVINTLRRAIGELETDGSIVRDLEAIKKNLDV